MNGRLSTSDESEVASILFRHGWRARLDPSKRRIRCLPKVRQVYDITLAFLAYLQVGFENRGRFESSSHGACRENKARRLLCRLAWR